MLTDHAVKPGLCLAAIAMMAAFAGCDRKPASVPVDNMAATSAQPKASPTQPKTVATPVTVAPPPHPSPARDIASLEGLWRVVHVDGGQAEKYAFAQEDRRLMGALLEIHPDQMAWSYRPAADFPGNEICTTPYTGPVESGAADPILRPRFNAAMARFGTVLALPTNPHEIECPGGGRWGPGQLGTAYFYALARNTIVMSWFGDTILMLERTQGQGTPAPASGLPLRADDYKP